MDRRLDALVKNPEVRRPEVGGRAGLAAADRHEHLDQTDVDLLGCPGAQKDEVLDLFVGTSFAGTQRGHGANEGERCSQSGRNAATEGR